MALDLSPLDSASRLMVEAELKVAMGGGGRFQPTGFPDLGPALYRGADGANWLLVESPQSMANRLERVCWIDGDGETDRVGRYNDACKGIPYVLATDSDNKPLSASTLEAHRLSSPYIWDTQPFIAQGPPSKSTDEGGASSHKSPADSASDYIRVDETLPVYLKRLFGLADNRLVPWKKVAEGLMKVDPGCLLHGVWFNEGSFAGGKVRITRSVSGYIEARDPATANFGFQKRDAVSDRTDKEAGQSAAEGYGSVIGPKQHFTSPKVKAYFQIDAERLRSFGLTNDQVRALIAWAIYKIRRVLVASRDGIADLRTECKFEVNQRKTDVEDKSDNPAMEDAIDCWWVHQETGKRMPFALPVIDDDLKAAFAALKTSTGPLSVRWVPNIEGKAELAEGMEEHAIKRIGLEAKVKVELPKPKKGKKENKHAKKILILFGEWTASDKDNLREQNEDPAKSVVEKAIKDYEKKWEAKAQSRIADKDDSDDVDENEEPE